MNIETEEVAFAMQNIDAAIELLAKKTAEKIFFIDWVSQEDAKTFASKVIAAAMRKAIGCPA